MQLDPTEVITIRTLECDICERYDSLLLSRREIQNKIEKNSLNIGSKIISHRDHLRIVYFDRNGTYLGDTMSLNIQARQQRMTTSQDLPFLHRETTPLKRSFSRKMLRLFTKYDFSLCIIGPTMAGKTSLSLYLDSSLPERVTQRVNHPPTMGRSVRHIKLGRNRLTIMDMGGQRNFWDQWSLALKKSTRVIFVLDGASNDITEIRESMQLLFANISEDSTLLIIFNKIDLFLEGYSQTFLTPQQILHGLDIPQHLNYWIIEASIYNGVIYNYADNPEESSLSLAIVDFLHR